MNRFLECAIPSRQDVEPTMETEDHVQARRVDATTTKQTDDMTMDDLFEDDEDDNICPAGHDKNDRSTSSNVITGRVSSWTARRNPVSIFPTHRSDVNASEG